MEIEIKLDKSKLRKKGHPVIISIFVSKTDRQYPVTGYYSMPEDWNEQKNTPKNSHPLYYGLMEFIHKTNMKINKILERRTLMSSEEIKNFILNDNPDSLVKFWQRYADEVRRNGSESNAAVYENRLKALTSFKTDVLFKEVTYDFLVKYKEFHFSKKTKSGKKRVSNNTMTLYLKTMKSVMKEAKKRRLYTPDDSHDPFDGIYPKSTPTIDKYITIEEMRDIVKYDYKHEFYDFFILCFLLGGIDYIDLKNLTYDHVKNGRIIFERFKGGTSEIVNNYIFPHASVILEKYKDDTGYLVPIHQLEKERFQFRDSYMHKIRRWIKGIGINSYVSTKTPRYTFINIGKQLLLSRDIIMELTGHSHGDVHSIYEGKYPDHVKDEVHRKIIDAVFLDWMNEIK
ncbi:tyrosine-type recombinase/integrase [Chryseobacterium culicis]|uniref:tyrosine-type recombinase/integrase n=1 Tax=Chryseobacterium culicis TaxID=680127 RepID=UPI0018763998|nr:site-specific integrase [Chryseobacterium culicis]MBE4949958.1 site-specific integrase [Chryseobacterium culicis]